MKLLKTYPSVHFQENQPKILQQIRQDFQRHYSSNLFESQAVENLQHPQTSNKFCGMPHFLTI